MDGHSYSGIRGYSDKRGGGRRVDIPGLYMDGRCYSGVRGYSDMGGEGGHPWTIHGWSQLLPAKYKATVSIHGWQRIVYGTIGHTWKMVCNEHNILYQILSFRGEGTHVPLVMPISSNINSSPASIQLAQYSLCTVQDVLSCSVTFAMSLEYP